MDRDFLNKDKITIIELDSQKNLFHMDIIEKKSLILPEK